MKNTFWLLNRNEKIACAVVYVAFGAVWLAIVGLIVAALVKYVFGA